MKKATNWTVSQKFLNCKTPKNPDFKKPKWVEFCEHFINYPGMVIKLYEARQTFSKYVTLHYQGQEFKVRFSNHKPIKNRELNQDCNFFVGVNHTTITTTTMAMEAAENWLKTFPKS